MPPSSAQISLPSASSTPSERPQKRRIIVTGLLLGMFLTAIEVTIVSTAMPRIVKELGGEELYSFPFAFFMLLSTVTGPVWGYLSDVLGRRRWYLAAVVLFLAGSMLCGASPNMTWLVAARALQGVGAGGVNTLTFTLIGELYPAAQRAKVQGFISAVWGASALLGPLVGGFIVDHLTWRWVFYLNLPFGIVASYLVVAYYVDHVQTSRGRIDLVGAFIFAVGASLLVAGLQMHRSELALMGGVSLVGFLWLELRIKSPLLPIGLLKKAVPGLATLGNLLAGTAFFGITTYLPLFVQHARGETATVSGAALAPITFGWVTATTLATPLVASGRIRRLTLAGGTLMTIGYMALLLVLQQKLYFISLVGIIIGLGMGTTMLVLLISAQEASPREQLGSMTASLLFARNIGGTLGSAIMGAVIGPSLEVGGAALQDAFWRAPLLAALVSFGILLMAIKLPSQLQAVNR